MGDVRALLLRSPPPPPFLGIYLDACGSVQRYAPSIRRILGAPDADAASSKATRPPIAPLLVVPDPHASGGGGVLGITLDHRDPQQPGRDGMDTLFAVVAAAAADGGLVLECLTAGPAAAASLSATAAAAAAAPATERGEDVAGRGWQWVRERGASGTGGAYSYDGMFFALFRVAGRAAPPPAAPAPE
jgi:hypothetical protein